MLIWRQFKPSPSLVPAPALHRQEHKHRKRSARLAQPIKTLGTSSSVRNHFKSLRNHFKLFWPETLLDLFSDSPMRGQLEKSLLLEVLTPHSSHTPVAALLLTWKLCKQTQTAQNIGSRQCLPIQTGVIVFGSLLLRNSSCLPTSLWHF